MSRSIRPTNYTRPEPPTYRIEITGNLVNYIPIKPKESK